MALSGKYAGPHAAARGVVGKMSDDGFAVLENMAVAIDDFQWFHKILLCELKFASRRLVKICTIIPVSTEALRDVRRRESAGWLSRPLSVGTCKVLSLEPGSDQALSDQQIGLFLFIHRLSIPQRQPPASDPIDGPHAGREKNRQRKRNAHDSNEQHAADHTPEERKPERPDLPAKVRLEVAASRFSSLYIVDDDGNDRRHAKDEGTDNSRGGCYTDQQAQRVQGIDTMGNSNEARRRSSDRCCGVVRHERCSVSRITLRDDP